MTSLNRSTIHFLNLIKKYLISKGTDTAVPGDVSEMDLNEIMNIALHNKCEPFIYHMIWKWAAGRGMDAGELDKYRNSVIYSATVQLRAEAELAEVIRDLNAAGVKFMLLKGVILSSLYPHPEYRRSCDADIHVDDEYAERAAAVFLARGYVYDTAGTHKYEKTYILTGILSIELHTRLFEQFYEKNRAVIAETGLDSDKFRKEIKVLGSTCETLQPNHFLLYVICHHTKHFITGGINIRHLMDICVYVNEYAEQLDWDFITSSLGKFGIKDFALNLLYICQHYMGMVDLSFLYRDIEEEVVLMLLYDIAERDVFERSASYGVGLDAYYSGSAKKGLSMFKQVILPNAKEIGSKYRYAKKYPILLPVAWVHRAFSYMRRKLIGKKIISPSERTKLATDRIELLKRVKML